MPVSIAPQDGDYVSEKRVGNGFSYTDLDDILQGLGATRVLITGLASHSCVADTVWGAIVNGYKVVIPEDGHTGGQDGHMAGRQNGVWRDQGLDVIHSADLDWARQCSVGAIDTES